MNRFTDIYNVVYFSQYREESIAYEKFPNKIDKIIFEIFDVPIEEDTFPNLSVVQVNYDRLKKTLKLRGVTWPFGNADNVTKLVLFKALLAKNGIKFEKN
jgi:hypothetical protein